MVLRLLAPPILLIIWLCGCPLHLCNTHRQARCCSTSYCRHSALSCSFVGSCLLMADRVVAGRPPDPRQPGSGCVELGHHEHVSLTKASLGVWRLKHALTGERVRIEVKEGEQAPRLHIDGASGFAFGSIAGKVSWVSSFFRCSAWRASADSDAVFIMQRGQEDAVDIKWQSEVQDEFAPIYLEMVPSMPAVKVLTFRVARPCQWQFFWNLFTLASLLDRGDQEVYSRVGPAGLRKWLGQGMARWGEAMLKCGIVRDEVVHPAPPDKPCAPLQNEGWIASTRATLWLLIHWSVHMATDAAKGSALRLLEAALQSRIAGDFSLQVHADPDWRLMLEHGRPAVDICVSALQVDLELTREAVADVVKLPLKFRGAIFPSGAPSLLPLSSWLCLLMVRPNAQWLLCQLLDRLACKMEAEWDAEPDIFAPLRANLADYAHRLDPAMRRAACLAARAKRGGARLWKAAKVLGKKGLGPT